MLAEGVGGKMISKFVNSRLMVNMGCLCLLVVFFYFPLFPEVLDLKEDI